MVKPEEIVAHLARDFEIDPIAWGQLFFPNHFSMLTPKFHFDLMDAAMKYRHLAVASPRYSAKSTLLSFLYPFHCIVFKRKRFILLLSNTFHKASMYLDSIKKEVTSNETFKQVFKGITLTRDAEGDTIFHHADGFEINILCKGVDQIGSIRGVKFGYSRPDLILLDDVEDDKLVRNQMLRQQLQLEFDEALTPAGDGTNCQYIAIGTIFHDDSQLAKLVAQDKYPEYHKIFLKAHIDADTPQEKSLWPEKWSLDDLKLLRKEKPNVYAKEMQNDPVAGSNTRFKHDDFRYWKGSDGKVTLFCEGESIGNSYQYSECKASISCDLAWKEKRESDSSVIMPGLITPNSEILVDTYVSKKGMRPDETAEQLFLMVERLEKLTGSVVPVGFEKAMLENVTQWLLKREMQKRNKFLLTKELVWDTDKNTRIETRLQPRYSQHVIYHKQGMGDLEYQLERFPYGTHDDLIDALQGLVQLLQYPKQMSSKPDSSDEFMRVRQIMIESKDPSVKGHRYQGRRRFPYPLHLSFR